MISNSLIVVAGGEPADQETILQALGDEHHVVAAQTLEDALGYVEDSVALVICDLDSSRLHGMDLIKQWKTRNGRSPILALADGSDVNTAIEAMREGAADCLVKPIDQDDLRSAALRLIETNSDTHSMHRNDEAGTGARKAHIEIPPGTSLEDLERAAVEQALVQHHGNRTHAAKTLGISVRTLQRKLKAWGMPIMGLPGGNSSNNNFMMGGQSAPQHAYSTHVH
jgi:DNA-binding NtrC family response regulator